LTDADLLFVGEAGFGRYIVDAGIMFIGRAFVVLFVEFVGDTCPGLTTDGDILVGVLFGESTSD
jgi:hypothetical protein